MRIKTCSLATILIVGLQLRTQMMIQILINLQTVHTVFISELELPFLSPADIITVPICSLFCSSKCSSRKKETFVLRIFRTTLVNGGSFQASLVQVDSWMFMLGLTGTDGHQIATEVLLQRIRTRDLQIAGKRCIHYASQDGPIHLQSGCGFVRLYRRYRAPPEVFMQEIWRLEMRRYILHKASLAQPTPVLRRGEGLENCESFLPDT